jgi:DNA-binding NarL/FixJ family response regulator
MYKIFIVDDDKHVVSALTELLEVTDKIRISGSVDNEESAIEWLVENRLVWNMLIVDLALGSGSGLRILSACRVRQANQKVAVLSGHLDSAMQRRCNELGADAVFAKDKDIEALIRYCELLSKKWALSF